MPNLFLIGAPKAGTTSIYQLLQKTEEVFCSEKKEPHFHSLTKTFNSYIPNYAVKNEQQYLDLYIEAKEPWVLDASVTYLYDLACLCKLSADHNHKFILCLRMPSDATKSMIRQRLKSINPTKRDEYYHVALTEIETLGARKSYPAGCFSEILFNYKELYDYEKFVPIIDQLIDRKQLLIIFFEDIRDNSEKVAKNLSEFLNIQLQDRKVNKENISYQIERSIATQMYAQLYRLICRFSTHEKLENFFIEKIFRRCLKTHQVSIDLSEFSYLKKLDAFYANFKTNYDFTSK